MARTWDPRGSHGADSWAVILGRPMAYQEKAPVSSRRLPTGQGPRMPSRWTGRQARCEPHPPSKVTPQIVKTISLRYYTNYYYDGDYYDGDDYANYYYYHYHYHYHCYYYY